MDARAAMGESIKLRDETECAKPLPGFAVNASPKQVLAAARSARFFTLCRACPARAAWFSPTRTVGARGNARLRGSAAIQRGRAVDLLPDADKGGRKIE